MMAEQQALSIAEKRKLCILGDLPPGFLRVRKSEDDNQAFHGRQFGTTSGPIQYTPAGQLDISIIQAKLAKNYGFTKMDPYCRIRVGHQIYETPTCISGSKNPKWGRRFSCMLPEGVDAFYIEIMDEKTFSEDERIAWVHITLPAAIFNGDMVDDWYSLSGKLGEEKEGMINIILSYKEIQVPVNQPQVHYSALPYNPAFVQPVMGGLPPGAHAQFPPQQGYHPQAGFPPQPVFPPQQASSQQQPVEVQDEEVKAVAEMFPSVDEDVVRSVLEEKGGDKDAAITALLSMA